MKVRVNGKRISLKEWQESLGKQGKSQQKGKQKREESKQAQTLGDSQEQEHQKQPQQKKAKAGVKSAEGKTTKKQNNASSNSK